MELTPRQRKLLFLVQEWHGDQKRKYTGEPYWEHPLAVAEIANKYVKGAVEIALCHDLFEDTHCTFKMLYKALIRIGYARAKAYEICYAVEELSDVFTSEDFPYLNRKERKRIENIRLSKISPLAQSIKYADLMHNLESIVAHDEDFAVVYLKECHTLITMMVNGNGELRNLCAGAFFKAEEQFINKKYGL